MDEQEFWERANHIWSQIKHGSAETWRDDVIVTLKSVYDAGYQKAREDEGYTY